MANKKIIQEGIVTPTINLGTQNGSSLIDYNSVTDTVTIESHLSVIGDLTVTNTVDVTVSDNKITLNSGELGSGITLGTAGIEIDRGLLTDVEFVYDESISSFIGQLVSGAPIHISTSSVPTTNNHITNKSYVDTTIASSISALSVPNILSDLSDVDPVTGSEVLPPPGPATGLVFNSGSSTWEPKIIPPGISQITINSTSDPDIIVDTPVQIGPSPVFNISLKPTTVSANSYDAATITVDANGRITSASDGNVWKTINTDAAGSMTPIGSSTLTIKGDSGIINTTATGNLITINLNDTTVTSGFYTNANITIDAQGRITNAANGAGVNTYKTITGDSGTTTATSPTDSLSITGQDGISTVAGSDNVTIALGNTTVNANSYTNADITIDAQGRITAAANGTAAFTDKILEGNSSVEVIDTGTGHVDIKVDNALIALFTSTTLEVDGDIISSGNLIGFSAVPSDITLKTNIKTIENALDTVIKLRGVSFNMAATGEASIGVIAQELQKELPELVTETSDGKLAVRYAQLTGLLIEAIKTLETRVTDLERGK